ncbi:hypothetical protein [Burkholderia ubonensis]|uniref:hypothetical protein n=1 Tax=Burkholderia ubonensis TaxID=101571 RepID=UPI000B13DBE4|nr:hypothetical protein [Burkholderia ubonensis]
MLFHSIDHLLRLSGDGVELVARPGRARADGGRYRHRDGTVLEALTHVLDDAQPRRAIGTGGVAVLLGFPHIRVIALPWQDWAIRPSDFDGFAREMFVEQYGAQSGQWDISVEQAAYGRARVAVAVDPGFLSEVSAILTTARLRMLTCRPLLLEAERRYRKRLPNDCLFSLAEPASVSCLDRSDGEWRRAVTLSRVARMSLEETLNAAQMMAGVLHARTLVVSDDAPEGSTLPDQPIEWLGSAHPWLDPRMP